MSPVGSVRARLSRCSWQLGLKCYPCYFCRGVVAAAAVTARVSVLPVVGSDLPTGLSAAVGVTEQFVVDLGNTLDKVGHGAGQSCVRIVPAERLPDLREFCDIMFCWIRPVAVLTSQFFLSDEKGDMDMPSHINGGRASLQQEVDFDSLNRCPQKMRHALSAGPAVDRWDWERIIKFIKWFCMLLDIPKLADSNGLRDLDRKHKLKLCGMMVQSSVQTPGSGPEIASYPRLESDDGTSNSGDRQMGRYDDADWFKENPNRAVGMEISRTIRRRPLRNCPWIFSRYLSRRLREDSWNWPRRPGTFILKMSSVFLWTKFYHK